MPDGSQPNAVDNGSYHQFAFLPGLPSGWPSIRFQGVDDNTGFWYDSDTKSIKIRFAGVDTYTFDDTGGMTTTVQMSFNAEDGLTAFAGGGQGSATQLGAKNYHRVSTTTTHGDSVKLPAATVGAFHCVRNDGLTHCYIYPQTGETIDGLGANTSVPLGVKVSAIFVCYTAGAWHSLNKMGMSGSTAFAPTLDFGNYQAGVLHYIRTDSSVRTCGFGNDGTFFGFRVLNTGSFSWSSTGDATGSLDTFLFRDAAGTIAQRNSTNAQTFRVYNTFTDASNYERGDVGWSANVFEVGTVNAGTGSNRSVRIKSSLTIAFSTGGDRFTMNATAFSPAADVTYDLGNSSGYFKDTYYRRRITKIATITYSASMTPDAALGDQQTITVTSGVAFTINAPTNPLTGQWLEIMIRNTSGGAAGAATWNAVFKMAAWTNPATANSRSITFRYDGTNWVETGRTTADVPN